MLDPRISYEALKHEFEDDRTLLEQLEASRLALRSRFAKYTSPPQTVDSSGSTHLSATPSESFSMLSSSVTSRSGLNSNTGSPTKNYTARFQRKRAAIDELTEFWSLPQEDFQSCDPVRWWYGRRAQFPKLYHLARDILSIPGIFLHDSVYLGHHLFYFRICCCGRAHIFRWPRHDFSSPCKPQA